MKTINTKSINAILATMLLDSRNSLVPANAPFFGVTGLKLPVDIEPKFKLFDAIITLLYYSDKIKFLNFPVRDYLPRMKS